MEKVGEELWSLNNLKTMDNDKLPTRIVQNRRKKNDTEPD